MAANKLTANEFKNGAWTNSYKVESVEDLQEIIRVVKRYPGETTPDCWNIEDMGGTVIYVEKNED